MQRRIRTTVPLPHIRSMHLQEFHGVESALRSFMERRITPGGSCCEHGCTSWPPLLCWLLPLSEACLVMSFSSGARLVVAADLLEDWGTSCFAEKLSMLLQNVEDDESLEVDIAKRVGDAIALTMRRKVSPPLSTVPA
jgi:hypothetical protein